MYADCGKQSSKTLTHPLPLGHRGRGRRQFGFSAVGVRRLAHRAASVLVHRMQRRRSVVSLARRRTNGEIPAHGQRTHPVPALTLRAQRPCLAFPTRINTACKHVVLHLTVG